MCDLIGHVSPEGKTNFPPELRRRWGIEDGGEILFIDLGDVVLIAPGSMSEASAELKRVLADGYSEGVAAMKDPEFLDQESIHSCVVMVAI